ncbi:MAG: hypothetical protein HY601_02185 [Candidatus Omnitrophica bacterium]|nr:hypothetical protein [Candidatus Omnitrophota bacterium]
MPDARLALSLVEKGWHGAREHTKSLPGGWRVVHLVKGPVDPSVRRLLGLDARTRLVGIPRRWYWPVAWAMLVRWGVTRRLGALVVDNTRAQRRMRPWAAWTGATVVWPGGPAETA